MIVMKVKCPRCRQVQTCFQGEPDTTCNCHLYCEDGSKPSDCTLVDHTAASIDAWNGKYNWPQGMHLGRGKTQDNTQNRVYWCTTHGKFTDKLPVLIPCDWKTFMLSRAPRDLRFTKGTV